jgi:hypothetical protein
MHLPARRSGRGRITSVRSGAEPCKCPAQVRAIAALPSPNGPRQKAAIGLRLFAELTPKNNCPAVYIKLPESSGRRKQRHLRLSSHWGRAGSIFLPADR